MAGKGSIIDRNGKFYLKIYKGKIDGKDKNKWVRLNATTEKEAEDERAYININRPNLWSDPSRITFSYYAKQFLEDMDRAVKCGRKAVATYEWYEQRIRNHINPKIGRLKFIEIKARDLQSLYDGIYSTSPNMADAVYRILHVMWAEAFRDEDLGVKCNLANKIHKGEKEKYQAPTWTGEQITYFLQNAKSRRYYEVFLLGFAAGMRLGEILGLTWDNIDHKEMIIHVKRSVTLNKKYDLEDLFKRTKNNSSIREIRMILVVSDALKELKKRQTAEELAVSIYHKSGLVFTTEKGQPVNYSNLRENYWFRLIGQLNNEDHPLPLMKIHSMRHSCATWLYNEMGIPLEIIQDILGHSTPLITKTLYTHASVKAQDQAMKLINDRFRDAGL